MKKTVTISLILAASFGVQAGENFAGINFHSSMPNSQVNALKNDLIYLYKTPFKVIDQDFKRVSEIKKVDGPNMYNWILNRVKHIVGESYQLNSRNVVSQKGHKFPNTPLPDLSARQSAMVIMSNIGSAIYLSGKIEDVLYGLRLDEGVVLGKSTRIGVLQVGEGLFHKNLLVNKNSLSSANSISRLGTLFHEARHSDGNSEHTGFIHDKCPSGHAYAGLAACEASSNGSYSVGAYSERNLLKNCSTCSIEDKTIINSMIADNLNRIIINSDDSRIKDIENQIAFMEKVVISYRVIMKFSSDDRKEKLKKEIIALEDKIHSLKQEKSMILSRPDLQPKRLDPRPEGEYSEISILESNQLMNRSLR